jgi:zinc D-Ala-D-Ala carboxypeptidase
MPGVIRKNGNGAIQLSPNFYLSELVESDTATRLGIENNPDPHAVKNLYALAQLLEKIRKVLGDKPVLISSGYRCVRLNEAVGGVPSSDHVLGAAADFRCPTFGNPLQIANAIAASDAEFGQLIQEGTWVHVSLQAPAGTGKRQLLTAKFGPDGKASYRQGLA